MTRTVYEERARAIMFEPLVYVPHVTGCGCNHEVWDPDCPSVQGRIKLIAIALESAANAAHACQHGTVCCPEPL